jgi:hypothetical protein
MKEFDQPRIEQTQRYFEQSQFAVESVQVGDDTYEYYVIPQQLNPDLADFALRMTRTISETGEVTGIFGVSDSVPTELRPHWVKHEVIEFTQIGIATEGRCAAAEQQVVNQLPVELRDAYIERRKGFFENLVGFFQNDIDLGTGNYTVEDLHEAEASLTFLNSLSS